MGLTKRLLEHDMNRPRALALQGLPVVSESDAQVMAAIRNECAAFMTRMRERITPEQQARWWAGLGREYSCFLYALHGETVGYGLLHEEDGKLWLTGGLRTIWRRQGLGRQLFRHLLSIAVDRRLPVWLEVLESNRAAIALYESLGFVEMTRGERAGETIVTMQLKRRTVFEGCTWTWA